MQPTPVNEIRDEMGTVIEKIYNPTIGLYDVMVTTGPSYMTKRQEALDNMATILQSNPQVWSIAGDLFVKNMDWPGAQEMAARFKKIIDPKLLEDDDKSPVLQQAEQQIEALSQELNIMSDMLQKVQQSMEAQELQIKAYDAETKRISAVQQSMTPEQIQDIVMGTISAAMDTGDIMPGNIQLPPMEPMEQPPMEQPMPEQPMPMGPMA